MKRLIAIIFSIPLLAYCGGGNVDISKAKRLQAEPVDTPAPGSDNPKVDGLFGKGPGFSAKLSSLGVVDPVGTALNDDFDGDGITNGNETTSNFWVADYPMIDTEIAPPVTMEIRVDQVGTGETDVISSDINSDDFESRKNEGSEKYHQNEVGLRTERYERETSNSSEDSFNVQASMEGGFLSANSKVSAAYGQTKKRASSLRTTVFEDRPNRNNIDRTARSVKSDSASNKARKYRKEKRQKQSENYTISANAGYVRAALFIKNFSVNMPVNLSNVLASLVFETAQGQIIPVQSFRLRNDDYSMFEIDVYGGSEFGPYVIELNGLNTVEVEKAIANGYTPKIFIVDYDLRHVEDSNYKTALSGSFTGNNLKIIEENAKGRTALMKIIGPNRRDMYRVTAFDVDMVDPDPAKICDLSNVDSGGSAAAGVSMETALNRIACSGDTIEYENYLFDFSGLEVTEAIKDNEAFSTFERREYVMIRGIKNLDGIETKVTCDDTIDAANLTDANGVDQPIEICYVRAASMSTADFNSLGVWAIFANGKYFDDTREARVDINTAASVDVETCSSDPVTPPCDIAVSEGIKSRIWAGDNYDIAYISTADLEERVQEFGTNPLETGAALAYNTKWNKSTVGEYAFHPDVNSTFLGKAGLGDEIEIKFKLDQSKYLNASFGSAYEANGVISYKDFSYTIDEASRIEENKLFSLEEAIDFELNLGLGGTSGHWVNLVRTEADDTFSFSACENQGNSWDYLKQEFTICVRLPDAISGVAEDGLLSLYLRPTLNNAHRESIWPLPYSEVKQFDGKLRKAVAEGATQVEVDAPNGSLAAGSYSPTKQIKIGGEFNDITSVDYEPTVYRITLSEKLNIDHSEGVTVTLKDETFTAELRTTVVNAASSVVTSIELDNANEPLPLGTTASGKLLVVDSGVNAETVEIESVSQREEVYLIDLAAALESDHETNSRVFVNLESALTTPQVSLGYHKRDSDGATFFSEWSDEYNTSLMPAAMENFGLLLTGNESLTDCYLSGIYLPSHCQGYINDHIITNWIGAGSLQNDWADASNFDSFLNSYQIPYSFLNTSENFNFFLDTGDGTVGPLVTASNSSIQEVSVANSTSGCQRLPKVAAADNKKAVVVWQYHSSNCSSTTFDLMARVVDFGASSAAELIGNDITLSSGLTHSGSLQYIDTTKIVKSGNKLLVLYRDGTDLRGRIVDMSQQDGSELSGSDTVIADLNTVNVSYFNYDAELVDTDKILVVYSYSNSSVLRGAYIDVGGTSPSIGAPFAVSSSGSLVGDAYTPNISVGGTKAIVTWLNGSTTYGQIIDLAASQGSETDGTDFSILSGGHSNVVAYNDKALVVAYSYPALNGRLIDLEASDAGRFLSSAFIVADNGASIEEVRPRLVAQANRVLVAYTGFNSGGNDTIYGVLVDFDAPANDWVSDDNFQISDQVAQTVLADVILIGEKALVTYVQSSSSLNNVKGRIVNLNGIWPNEPLDGGHFSLGTLNASYHQGDIDLSGSFADGGLSSAILDYRVVSAFSGKPSGAMKDTFVSTTALQPGVFSLGSPSALNMGKKNFMTAPLIERDYTVISRLKY